MPVMKLPPGSPPPNVADIASLMGPVGVVAQAPEAMAALKEAAYSRYLRNFFRGDPASSVPSIGARVKALMTPAAEVPTMAMPSYLGPEFEANIQRLRARTPPIADAMTKAGAFAGDRTVGGVGGDMAGVALRRQLMLRGLHE